MNKKNMKKEGYFYTAFQLGALEKHLEEMATAGWMFVKQKGMLLYFEKCEPRKIHFGIEICSNSSSYDVKPEGESEEFVDFCEAGGWNLIQNNGKLMFFYNEDEDPVPIQTDQEIKLKGIFKYVGMERIFPFIALLFCSLAMLITPIRFYNGLVDLLITNDIGLTALVYFVITCYFGIDVVAFIIFYRKNKKRVKNGDDIIYSSKRTNAWARRILIVILFTCLYVDLYIATCNEESVALKVLFYAIGVLGFLIIFIEWFRQGNRKISNNVSAFLSYLPIILLIVLLVFSPIFAFNNPSQETITYTDSKGNITGQTITHADIPITLEKLGIDRNANAKYTDTSSYVYSSIFGKSIDYTETYFDQYTNPIKDFMEYRVVTSWSNTILDDYVKNRLSTEWTTWKDITSKEGDLWGAEEVYGNTEPDGTVYRIVKWKDAVLEFNAPGVEINQNTVGILKDAIP